LAIFRRQILEKKKSVCAVTTLWKFLSENPKIICCAFNKNLTEGDYCLFGEPFSLVFAISEFRKKQKPKFGATFFKIFP
jgi:hypothetical protein